MDVTTLLLATYILFLLLEVTDLLRGRSRRVWVFVRFPFAVLALAGVLALQAQPIPETEDLRIPPATTLHRETRGPGMFWYIHHFSRLHGVDPLLVRAVIEVESGFDPRAVSHKGAKGLMQINPITAKHLGVRDVFDVSQNVEAGVRYLRYLLESYGWNLHRALAAYNAGPATVRQYNGIPPFRETRRYVKRVVKAYERLRRTNEVFNDKSRLASLRPYAHIEAQRAIP